MASTGESLTEKLARGRLLLQGHVYACRCPHVGDIKTHGLLNCAIFTATQESRPPHKPDTFTYQLLRLSVLSYKTHMELSAYVNSMESCSTRRTFGRCFGSQQKLRVDVETPQSSIWAIIKKCVQFILTEVPLINIFNADVSSKCLYTCWQKCIKIIVLLTNLIFKING